MNEELIQIILKSRITKQGRWHKNDYSRLMTELNDFVFDAMALRKAYIFCKIDIPQELDILVDTANTLKEKVDEMAPNDFKNLATILLTDC